MVALRSPKPDLTFLFFRLTCQHFLSDLTSVSLSSPSHLADVVVGCLGFGGSGEGKWGSRTLVYITGVPDTYNVLKNSLRSLALQRSRLSVWANPHFHHWRPFTPLGVLYFYFYNPRAAGLPHVSSILEMIYIVDHPRVYASITRMGRNNSPKQPCKNNNK